MNCLATATLYQDHLGHAGGIWLNCRLPAGHDARLHRWWQDGPGGESSAVVEWSGPADRDTHVDCDSDERTERVGSHNRVFHRRCFHSRRGRLVAVGKPSAKRDSQQKGIKSLMVAESICRCGKPASKHCPVCRCCEYEPPEWAPEENVVMPGWCYNCDEAS